jgi:hypothetical protein
LENNKQYKTQLHQNIEFRFLDKTPEEKFPGLNIGLATSKPD